MDKENCLRDAVAIAAAAAAAAVNEDDNNKNNNNNEFNNNENTNNSSFRIVDNDDVEAGVKEKSNDAVTSIGENNIGQGTRNRNGSVGLPSKIRPATEEIHYTKASPPPKIFSPSSSSPSLQQEVTAQSSSSNSSSTLINDDAATREQEKARRLQSSNDGSDKIAFETNQNNEAHTTYSATDNTSAAATTTSSASPTRAAARAARRARGQRANTPNLKIDKESQINADNSVKERAKMIHTQRADQGITPSSIVAEPSHSERSMSAQTTNSRFPSWTPSELMDQQMPPLTTEQVEQLRSANTNNNNNNTDNTKTRLMQEEAKCHPLQSQPQPLPHEVEENFKNTNDNNRNANNIDNNNSNNTESTSEVRPGAYHATGRAFGNIPTWARAINSRNNNDHSNDDEDDVDASVPPELRQQQRQGRHRRARSRFSLFSSQDSSVSPTILAQAEEVNEAETVLFAEEVNLDQSHRKNRCIIGLGICALILIITLTVALALSGDDRREEGDDKEIIVDPRCREDWTNQSIVIHCLCSNNTTLYTEQFTERDWDAYKSLSGHLIGLGVPETELLSTSCSPENQGLLFTSFISRVTDPSVRFEPSYVTHVFAVIVIYLKFGGLNWRNQRNWFSQRSVCDWHGIDCLFVETVHGLHWVDNELVGTFPSELRLLPHLRTIDFSSNPNITGKIPSEIGMISSLIEINLSGVGLHSTIPSEIGMLRRLDSLSASGCHLKGSIPTEFGNLRRLRLLDLSDNSLVGPIPSELGNLPVLGGVRLQKNTLTGSLPESIARLNYLDIINLASNQMSGTIPAGLGDLEYLEFVNLADSGLSGDIPESFCTDSNDDDADISTYGDGMMIYGENETGRLESATVRLVPTILFWCTNNTRTQRIFASCSCCEEQNSSFEPSEVAPQLDDPGRNSTIGGREGEMAAQNGPQNIPPDLLDVPNERPSLRLFCAEDVPAKILDTFV